MATGDGRDPLWIGIQKHGAGWRAIVSRGRGRAVMRHFTKDTDPREMQAWRADTRAGLRLTRKQRAFGGSFEHDARVYLRSVTALPDLAGRTRDVERWIAILGTTRRDRITPADIRRVRDQWMTEARSQTDTRPVGPATINKRLRALSNVWTVLDGRRSENPVRDVPELREPDPEPSGLTYDHIKAIIAALPDLGRAPKKGATRPTVSPTKIRIRCLSYCQVTPKQLTQLTPADLDLDVKRLRLPARMKGRGAKAIWTSLVPEAVEAFRDFDRHDCYGPFSQSSLRKSFKAAARRAGITVAGVKPYATRHAFGALAYRALGSLDAVGKLMQHTVRSTTERYALEAEAQVLAELSARVTKHFVDRPNGSTGAGPGGKQAENGGQASEAEAQNSRDGASDDSRKHQ